MRRLIIVVGLMACGADIERDIETLTEPQDCSCLRTVQKELDCGDGDVRVEYSQPWEVATLPVRECNDDWFVEDAFADAETGCLVSYYSNGECLTPLTE